MTLTDTRPAGRTGSAYRGLFADPQLFGFYLTGLLAQVSMGTVGLLVVFVVVQSKDGFGLAGALSGAVAAGFGVISPFRTRLVDRLGARSALVTGGVAHASAVTALWALVGGGVHLVVLIPLGVVIGATVPPTSAVMRAAWGVLLPDREQRRAAQVAESLGVRGATVVGPMLVSAALVTVGAGGGLLCCAALTLATSLALGLSPTLAAVLPPRMVGPTAPRLAVARRDGPPRLQMLLPVLPTAFCLFASVGAVELTVAAQAQAAGGWAVGWLLAAFGVGGLLGGLVWGRRVWPGQPPVQMIVLLTSFAAALTPLLVPLPLFAVGGLLLLAGAAFSPAMIAQLRVLDMVMPREALTESLGWLDAARQAGTAAAVGAAGVAIEVSGSHGGWLIAVVAALAAIAASALLSKPTEQTASTGEATHECGRLGFGAVTSGPHGTNLGRAPDARLAALLRHTGRGQLPGR